MDDHQNAIELPTEYESFDDLIKKGEELFGVDKRSWILVCPACGAKTPISAWFEYTDSPETANRYIGFSCVGRLIKQRQLETEDKSNPVHSIKVGSIGDKGNDYCNYSSGGLFNLNPVHIKDVDCYFFQFAPPSA